MRLRLTTPAARQLDRVLTYIAQHNPQGARNVQERLSDVLNVLLHHPYAGHRTARPGIHRMVVSPYPYAVTYRVMGDEIVVLGVRHTARRPLA
ncbi:type II toxin-antitoxin system RelE/ParE family toxin [Methylorubrum sp. SB2]|uniref:type II toxin-antitoxin system RelE/ParE family toxin n=1 Tax=Methylorubrum subtropicum TaxID=3138812 RepID=UPI00313B8A2C